MEVFDSLFSLGRHKYDIDVTVWPHAVRTASWSLHWDNSNERKLSPPGNDARPLESFPERACTRTSLPRSGGHCVIAGKWSPGWSPGCGTSPPAGDTRTRSSSRGNWHMKYKRPHSTPSALRMSRCRRVLVNMPKCSRKPGVKGGK